MYSERRPRSRAIPRFRTAMPLMAAALAPIVALALGTPVSAQPMDGAANAGGSIPVGQIDDLSTSISGDGKVASAPAAADGRQGMSSYPGDGKPGGDGASHDADKLPIQDPQEKPGIGVLTVFQPDDRTRIDPTTTFPASATVWLTRTDANGTRRWCSGWLYAANMVATAGHCVHGGKGRNWVPTHELRIWPGRNGTSAPYGSCTAQQIYSVKGWVEKGQPEYDYGAIKLNCTVGNSTGWYGWWWQSASLAGTAATISGYPFDKEDGTLWTHPSRIDTATDRQVHHFIDTWHGNSGSPIFQQRPPGSNYCTGNCVMGIHAYGSDQYHPRNAGTRIVERVGDNLRLWRDHG